MEEEVKLNIILDNGSGYIKAGFTGDEVSKTVFPTCVGYPLLYDGSIKSFNFCDVLTKTVQIYI